MKYNIKKFKSTQLKVALAGGLGTFLVLGFSGCDSKCSDNQKDKNCSGVSGSSGSFIPMMFNSSSTESTRSSGFFSPSSSTASSDSHGG